VLAGKAIDFVRRAKAPFFLYFTPIAPHLPALPAERDISTPLSLPKPRPNFDERDLSDKPWHSLYKRVYGPSALAYLNHDIEGRQLRSLRELDRQVGALMGALQQKGVLGNTIVIYASDNGFLWGEHRLGGKIWPYDESIRVPLVIRVPWQSAAGQTDDHMVLNIDFASTIAELAGVEPGLPQNGRSLVPFLRGKSVPWRDDFLVEYLGASQFYDGGPPPFQAVRSSRWLYVAYRNGWRELYDLRHDPYELRNVAADPRFATRERQLSQRLHRLARS
jgi:N-acetylglucosamine-6-sulfatase